MAFFQRVFHYVFNQLLVDALANNRSFQRFAIRSSEAISEFSKKGAESQAKYNERVTEFSKTFREEFRKGMQNLDSKQQQQQGPKR